MKGGTAKPRPLFLALAAKKMQKQDFSDWLARRAALLADVQKLRAQRPLLKQLWPEDA